MRKCCNFTSLNNYNGHSYNQIVWVLGVLVVHRVYNNENLFLSLRSIYDYNTE